MIVDDDGFTNQFKVSPHAVEQWGREGVEGHDSLAQGEEFEDDDVEADDEDEDEEGDDEDDDGAVKGLAQQARP